MVTELKSILLINVAAPADTRWAARLETISQIYLTFTQSWSDAWVKSNSANTSRHFVCESATSLESNRIVSYGRLIEYYDKIRLYAYFSISETYFVRNDPFVLNFSDPCPLKSNFCLVNFTNINLTISPMYIPLIIFSKL